MWSDLLGLLGVGMIVLAYFLVQARKTGFSDALYLHLNLWGSVLCLISLLVHWNLGGFLINSFWIAISAYGLMRRKGKTGEIAGRP